MKNYLLGLLFLATTISYAQNNYIVKTDDGRRVLLKADYTWEYIDLESTPTDSTPLKNTSIKPLKKANCGIAKNFIEPKLNRKIQSQLKKGRASIKYVKQKVAKDYNCSVANVILLSFKEQKSKANYIFCANGTKITYKRIGNTIIKKVALF